MSLLEPFSCQCCKHPALTAYQAAVRFPHGGHQLDGFWKSEMTSNNVMPFAGCGLVGEGSSDCCRRGNRSWRGHRAVSKVRRDCWSSESSFQSHFRRSTYAPGELSELQVVFLVPPGSPVCPQRSQQLIQPCCRVSSLTFQASYMHESDLAPVSEQQVLLPGCPLGSLVCPQRL